jgi:hypothetical protein
LGDYIELSFNVFDQSGQRARVRLSLTISELIVEILREFDEGKQSDAEMYALYLNKGSIPLPRSRTLAQLDVQLNDELEFKHLGGSRRTLIPKEQQAYLLEDSTRRVYEILWQPALIGRPDIDPDHNELLAVNLASHRFGKRVSRRHAQILLEGGQYYIENQSSHNPTFLNDDPTPLAGKQLLKQEDRIRLGKSQIVLTFFLTQNT